VRHLILSLTCYACVGQSVTAGVLGGGRLTNDVTLPALPESRFYDAGATIQVGLPLNFGLEFDAIYHRQGYLYQIGALPSVTTIQSERASDWEFPLLVKYKLPIPRVKPFAEVGLAPRKITGTITSDYEQISQLSNQLLFSTGRMGTNWANSVGFVAGGGVEFAVGRLRLSPELRYTMWTTKPIYEFPPPPGVLQSSQNQVDMVIGIAWKLR
jgi:hypothetical protein